MKSKRVQISGRGLCGSSGVNTKEFLRRFFSGISSINLIPEWNHLPVRMASVLDDSVLSPSELKLIEVDDGIKRIYMLQMALYEALDSAGLWVGKPWTPRPYLELVSDFSLFSNCVKKLPERVGIFLGVGAYPTPKCLVNSVIHMNQDPGWDRYDQTDFREIYGAVLDRSNLNFSSSEVLNYMLQIEQSFMVTFLRSLLGNRSTGPSVTISNLCVSSLQTIGEALRSLRTGEVDLAIVGGIEEYSFLSSFSFAALGAYSDAQNVEKASRPFDRKRRGIVLGEGCGLLVLEREYSILKRGHHSFADIIGYGGSNNHHHMTSSPSTGRGLTQAIKRCLEMADNPRVDMCISHGTGTINNDLSEAAAIRAAEIGEPLIQSIKSFTGHTLAGAGVYNVIAGLIQQEKSFFSHTLHLDDPDPLCKLNHIPRGGLSYESEVMLVNASGFGGMNACLLLKFD